MSSGKNRPPAHAPRSLVARFVRSGTNRWPAHAPRFLVARFVSSGTNRWPAASPGRLRLARGDDALASIRYPAYRLTIDMETVTLSPKFQVVIPQAVRKALRLTGGEKLRVISYADRVEFIPVRPMKQMRGYLRGMDTTLTRDPDRLRVS